MAEETDALASQPRASNMSLTGQARLSPTRLVTTSLANPHQKPGRSFMDLPGEIRMEIYSYALFMRMACPPTAWTLAALRPPPLAQVNRLIRREATSIWYEKVKLILRMDARDSASRLAFADMLHDAKDHGALTMVQDVWVDFICDMRSQGNSGHEPVQLATTVTLRVRFSREPKCRCKGFPCVTTEHNGQLTTLQATFEAEVAALQGIFSAAPDPACSSIWGIGDEAVWTDLHRSIESALTSLSRCCLSVLQNTSIEWDSPYMLPRPSETRKCLNYLKPTILASE